MNMALDKKKPRKYKGYKSFSILPKVRFVIIYKGTIMFHIVFRLTVLDQEVLLLFLLLQIILRIGKLKLLRNVYFLYSYII